MFIEKCQSQNRKLLTELKSDDALELGVLGFVNHAHAAFAELDEDFVVGDGLADHIINFLAK